jgi:uncharacterized protein (TIGR03435 family)
MYAYGVRQDQLVGGPAWITSDRCDILTKYPAGDLPSAAQVQQMVQTLLAERFALKTHKETREGSTYALVLVHRSIHDLTLRSSRA